LTRIDDVQAPIDFLLIFSGSLFFSVRGERPSFFPPPPILCTNSSTGCLCVFLLPFAFSLFPPRRFFFLFFLYFMALPSFFCRDEVFERGRMSSFPFSLFFPHSPFRALRFFSSCVSSCQAPPPEISLRLFFRTTASSGPPLGPKIPPRTPNLLIILRLSTLFARLCI